MTISENTGLASVTGSGFVWHDDTELADVTGSGNKVWVVWQEVDTRRLYACGGRK